MTFNNAQAAHVFGYHTSCCSYGRLLLLLLLSSSIIKVLTAQRAVRKLAIIIIIIIRHLHEYREPKTRLLGIQKGNCFWRHTGIRQSACKLSKKVKWSRYRPGVVQRVGRGIVLLFHDRGTRRGWVVSSTPRPHFTSGKDPVPIL